MIYEQRTVLTEQHNKRSKQAGTHYVLLNVLFVLLSPYVLLSKILSVIKRRPKHAYDLQRITGDQYPCDPVEPGKTRVVFLGAGFGESEMMDRLQTSIRDRGLPIDTVWTIRNRTELERIKRNRPQQKIALWPFDFYWCMNRWLKRTKPEILIVIEKLWFPGPILTAKASGSRVAVVNGRTNDRKNIFRKFFTLHYKWIVEAIDWIGMRADEFSETIREMKIQGNPVETSGNVKVGMPLPKMDPTKEESLRKWIQECQVPDKVFILGSSECAEEEEFVLKAFEAVKTKTNCCLLIAPRHINRAPEIVSLCESRGHQCSLRTEPNSGADVLILNTLGELASTFGLGIGSFIGGTIIGAGHNIIEPLQAGIPVAYGPVRDHFEDLQLLCEEKGVGFRVHRPEQLSEHWLQVLNEPEWARQVAQKAADVLEDGNKAYALTVDVLVKMIEEIESEKAMVQDLSSAPA